MTDFSESYSDYTLDRKRGDTVRVPFQFDVLTGTPNDYKIWFYGKLNPNDPDTAALFKLDTTGGGVTVTDNLTKKIEAIVPASASVNLTGKTTVYCEYQIMPLLGGDVQTVLGSCGRIIFKVDIVRPIT